MTDEEKLIHLLIKQAAEHHDANDAMKFSQAALNSANALLALNNINKKGQ